MHARAGAVVYHGFVFLQTVFLKQRLVADQHRRAAQARNDAEPRLVVERVGLRDGNASPPRVFDDRRGQRVLAELLRRRRQSKHLRLRHAV